LRFAVPQTLEVLTYKGLKCTYRMLIGKRFPPQLSLPFVVNCHFMNG
jgi:hypothetical protein